MTQAPRLFTFCKLPPLLILQVVPLQTPKAGRALLHDPQALIALNPNAHVVHVSQASAMEGWAE